MLREITNESEIKVSLKKYFSKKSNFNKIRNKGEIFHKISAVELLDSIFERVLWKISIVIETKSSEMLHRSFILKVYRENDDFSLIKRDQEHIAEIIRLDIYPVKKFHFEKNFHQIGYRFLLLETDPLTSVISNLEIDLDLKNLRAVNQRIHYYLLKRHHLRRRSHYLMEKGEQFLRVKETNPMGFGLNNAVFNICIEFISRNEGIQIRDYILRVSPNNSNALKIRNEANRMKDVQKIAIPKAKMYIYEDNPKYIGFRFMILEKLQGFPITETIHAFNQIQTKAFLADLARILGTLHSKRRKNYSSYYILQKSTKKLLFQDYVMMEAKRTIKNFKNLDLDKDLEVDTHYLYKWFIGHKPLFQLDGYSLIHGDIQPSNIIARGTQIQGIIDWEMSCFSDPAQDIGWSMFFFRLYENLKINRGFFFEEYWKVCDKYNVEARVFVFEFLQSLIIYFLD